MKEDDGMKEIYEEFKVNRNLKNFIKQSFLIEGEVIGSKELDTQMEEHKKLHEKIVGEKDEENMYKHVVSFADKLGGKLRKEYGLDVRVGDHLPPRGGPFVEYELIEMCKKIKDVRAEKHVLQFHIQFENLHPFTDGNGRTGRAIWWAQMCLLNKEHRLDLPLSFLQKFYYETLSNSR